MNVIRETTRHLIQIKDTARAISMFEEEFEYYRQSPPFEEFEDEGSFGFGDINIMTELYMSTDEYTKAITCIRRGVRWLQGRDAEIWWDSLNDDREFDENDKSNRRKAPHGRGSGLINTGNLVGGSNSP